MANEEVRNKAKAHRIPLWKLACKLGVSEATLTRWLRVELTPDKRQRVLEAIEEIIGGENND